MTGLAIPLTVQPPPDGRLPSDQVSPAEVSAAVGRLQELLRRCPGLPFKKYRTGFNYPCHDGTDEQNRAEVDEIAAILGVRAHTDSAGTYQAVFDCGADIVYRAYAIPNALRSAIQDQLRSTARGTAA